MRRGRSFEDDWRLVWDGPERGRAARVGFVPDASSWTAIDKLAFWVSILIVAGLCIAVTAAIYVGPRARSGSVEAPALVAAPEDNPAYRQLLPLHRDSAPMPVTLLGDETVQNGPWPQLLARPGEVGNFGIAGDTTAGLDKRLATALPLGPRVVVMIGANDHDAGMSAAESRAHFGRILQHLRGRDVFVFATPLTAFSWRNERLLVLNRAERDLCAAATGCHFVDMNPALMRGGVVAPDNTVDGIHLSLAGYRTWAAQIEGALSAH